MHTAEDFENKVYDSLLSYKIDIKNTEVINAQNCIGAAVSGGADSVSLLVSLVRLMEKEGRKGFLKVITVNHGIRSGEETDGDALYVENLCKVLGVECDVIKFEPGMVKNEALLRGKGIEEAARALRYKAFEEFIQKKNLKALCLAHNQNDQTETILMRLLNGSGSEGLGGIPEQRNKIIRPLLNISRAQIEEYLLHNKITWRTDKTNFDNHYSRNKIRNVLVPFLNENFPSWKEGVIAAGKKAQDDSSFIEKKASELIKQNDSIEFSQFVQLEDALKRRVIYLLLNKAGFSNRFPFKLVKEICRWNENAQRHSLTFEGVHISVKNGSLLFENTDSSVKKPVSYGYTFLFRSKADAFEYENLRLYIEENECRYFLNVLNTKGGEGGKLISRLEVSLPFFAGSVSCCETIKTADGKQKKITDIYSDWKVPENIRSLIPVVRLIKDKIVTAAVLGSVSGFPDWKVKS